MQEAVAKLNDLRQRVLNKQPVTKEELCEALTLIRAERKAATDRKEAKASAPKVTLPADLNDLFK